MRLYRHLRPCQAVLCFSEWVIKNLAFLSGYVSLRTVKRGNLWINFIHTSQSSGAVLGEI